MNDYKIKYNETLKRYYAGCNYIEEHPETYEKYINNILIFLERLNNIIKENNITDEDIILNGFKEE